MAAATPARPVPRSQRRTTLLASGVGTAIEWYDYMAYAFVAIIIGKLFFPSATPGVEVLSALAVFGVAFLFRPVGGMIFGHVADRFGRRPAMTISVVGMALFSAIIGIHANGQGALDQIARRMSELPFVTSVSIVTGRYDIIAEVLIEGDMADLYRVTSELLPGLAEPGRIGGSETFVVMRSHNRWLSVPKGVWEEEPADPRVRGRRAEA